MNSVEVISGFDLLMDDSYEESQEEFEKIPLDQAFFKCLDHKLCVDIEYISNLSGMTFSEVIEGLRGIIFQNPKNFIPGKQYDQIADWETAPQYLSGNIREKLVTAKRINAYFGKFDSNIEALTKILPEKVEIDEINISFGASWIPFYEYAQFIREFLDFDDEVEVFFNEELMSWKITPPKESRFSQRNNVTYGVRGNIHNRGAVKQYLTAIDICEATLNGKDIIKVYDYVPKGFGRWASGETEAVLNREKTLESQSKQNLIIEGFKDWVYSDDLRAKRFQEYYNQAYTSYNYSPYDGSFLTFSDMNPNVTLYKHQRDAIARALLSYENILLAHDVGAGKTYEMIVILHELYRLGKSKRNIMVVPKHLLKATVNSHKYLYKDDKILAVYSKDFAPAKRDETLEKIKNGDYVAIYMAYSSFDKIVMSKQYFVDKYSEEIRRLRTACYNTSSRAEKQLLQSRADHISKKLEKYIDEESQCTWLTYDKLGIETLIVDESHNYKNIPIDTKSSNIIGMNNGKSKKCREMLEKVHITPKTVFATGTPLTNSIADLYAIQLYLQPESLEFHRINTFDTWINTFGKRETTVECDVDANSNSLRTVTRFASFHNLNQLMGLFSQVCDFHHIDENEIGLPKFNGHVDIIVPKNIKQAEYIESLSQRTEDIRNRKVSRDEDNLLKVTTDGRKAALDYRLVCPDSDYVPDVETKIEACAKQVLELYKKYPDTAQIVFSDIGVPKSEFNVYDELREKLEDLGIPHNQIAYVHEADTENQREALFKSMNQGKIRVVLGSTSKLGVGVNVQERLVAIHHLSVPWRPADMCQREGRILRKGNNCEEVFIFRYITEGTFDAYSWQLLENKQRFISSFLQGVSVDSQADDIADTVLTYAEVKALAIGNKLIRTRVEVSTKLERTKIAFRTRQKQLQELKGTIEVCPIKIERLERLAEGSKRDFKRYKRTKIKLSNDERIAFGEELLEALKENIMKEEHRPFDEYQGFEILLPANMTEEKPYIFIKGNLENYQCLMDFEKTPLGCSKTIDYFLEHLDDRANKINIQAASVKKQMKEAKKDLAKGNLYAEEIEILKDRLASIDAELEGIVEEKKAG